MLSSFGEPLHLARFADQRLPMSKIVAVLRNPSRIHREAVISIKSSYKEEGISGLHSRIVRHTGLEDPRKETSDAG